MTAGVTSTTQDPKIFQAMYDDIKAEVGDSLARLWLRMLGPGAQDTRMIVTSWKKLGDHKFEVMLDGKYNVPPSTEGSDDMFFPQRMVMVLDAVQRAITFENNSVDNPTGPYGQGTRIGISCSGALQWLKANDDSKTFTMCNYGKVGWLGKNVEDSDPQETILAKWKDIKVKNRVDEA